MKQPRAVLVDICQLPNGKGLPLPAYQSAGAAGLDIAAAIAEHTTVVLQPGSHAIVPAGFAMALARGQEAQIRPRSGLAVKHGVTVLNSPGTIDADYRGEIGVILINLGQAPFEIRRGDRIAQMVITEAPQARLRVVKTLAETKRGSGGFGSTGTSTKSRETKRQSAKGKSGKTLILETSRNAKTAARTPAKPAKR